MTATSWNREQVENLLKTEHFRYQRIELPYGFATRGTDRSATARQIFPDDMTGKSVLDLGCSHGFFCFEAARRGATRVLGLDVEPEVIRKNHLLADCLNLKVEFGVHDIEKEPIIDQYDYVLCLNLLHHVLNPISVLENLIGVTRERLVLEMATFGAHDRRRLRLFPLYGQLLSLAPIIYVSRSGTSGRRELKRYFITQGAMRNMLEHHRRIFAKVEFKSSEHKGRYIVTAERQKIKNLIIVAGPTASGKSTFCDHFLGGRMIALYEKIGVNPLRENFTYMSARVSDNPRTPVLGHVLYHYDILRPYMRSARVHSRDEALDILSSAENTSVITLWTSPDQLRSQLKKSRRKLFRWRTKRERRIEQDYENPRRIVEHYETWFEFIRRHTTNITIVDQSAEQPRFLTYEEWKSHCDKIKNDS